MPLPTVPTLLLAVGGMALMLSRWVQSSRWFEGVWLAGIAGAVWLLATNEISVEAATVDEVSRTWIADPLAQAGQWLALLVGSLFGMGSFGIRSPRDRTAERFGFLSVLIAGMMLVITANDMVSFALSVEIVQFASWALRKCDRLESNCRTAVNDLDRASGHSSQHHDEAGLWLGIASSCCLWMGIAFLAVLTASTQFDEIRLVLADAYVPSDTRAVIGSGSKLGLLAIGLIVSGLGTRIGLVPWQIGFIESGRNVGYWTAGCILTAGQLTGVLALSRLCGTVWVGYRDELLLLLLVTAGLTGLVSAGLAGLGLTNGEGRLRRWSIAIAMLQTAWLSIGVIAAASDLAAPGQSLSAADGQPGALALLVFAIAASQVGTAGLFLMLAHLARDDREVEFIDELLGLGRLRPVAACALIVVLASLVGHPPLWGFWSHWLLLVAGLNVRAAGGRGVVAAHVGMIVLLIAITAATLMTAAVMIRFVRIMVLEPPIARTLPQGRRSALFVSCACGAILLAVGIYPAAIMNIVATVRIPDAKPTPDAPAGSTRGSATASQ